MKNHARALIIAVLAAGVTALSMAALQPVPTPPAEFVPVVTTPGAALNVELESPTPSPTSSPNEAPVEESPTPKKTYADLQPEVTTAPDKPEDAIGKYSPPPGAPPRPSPPTR
jgi:hypothetical protein